MSYKFNPFTGNLDLVGTSGGGSGGDSFTTIQTDYGTYPVAVGASTLSLTSANGTVIITGDSTTDTVDLAFSASLNLDGGTASSFYGMLFINGGGA